MVSEVVMYQSMFVLGIIMFGFFSVSFGNYTDYAEEVTLENNLQQVVDAIGERVSDLISKSRLYKDSSSSITSSISIDMESEYATSSYQLSFQNNSKGQAEIIAQQNPNSDILANYPLGYNGSIITFTGTLSSGDVNPVISYQWDGTSEIVTFS